MTTLPGNNPGDFHIDLSQLDAAIQRVGRAPDQQILQSGMLEAAEFVRQTWISAVTGNFLPGMSSTINSDKYAQGLQTGQSLQLTGPLAAMIICTWPDAEEYERGKPPFDMKPGLLQGPHHKIGKDGLPYNTVPFRFGTPQTGTRQGTPRQNMPEMPVDIYNIVKSGMRYKDPGDAAAGGQWGQQTKLPALINMRLQAAGKPERMQHSYQWKNGLYEGMQQRGAAGHHQYMTFRRVSTKSDNNAWWYPGLPANPIRQAVIDACRDKVTDHLTNVVIAAYGL